VDVVGAYRNGGLHFDRWPWPYLHRLDQAKYALQSKTLQLILFQVFDEKRLITFVSVGPAKEFYFWCQFYKTFFAVTEAAAK
jgi:hypothetical protein